MYNEINSILSEFYDISVVGEYGLADFKLYEYVKGEVTDGS